MLEHKRFLYSTLKWRIIMYHELPDHSSAPLLRNLDKNLNQYNALACNRESGWDFEGSDIWRILQGLPEFSRNTAFSVATTFIVLSDSLTLFAQVWLRLASGPELSIYLSAKPVSRSRQGKTASIRRAVADKMAHPAACSAGTI